MTVLVTGGAGYLGSVLVPRLRKRGQHVIVVDDLLHGGQSLLGVVHDENLGFLKGELRSDGSVADILGGVETVNHLPQLSETRHAPVNLNFRGKQT